MKTFQDLNTSLPGTAEIPPPPAQLIEEVRQRRGQSYRPRTKHLTPDGTAKYTNRLFLETSPYLLQHAHNPVNWFPWGNEAFDLARQLNRPLLVSIGYATCHWCHVMEEESFEDEEIALYLNSHFIAIKVDREERPDIDTVYMSAVHAMGMQGGWPLNVFLTPDRKPFYGGTYFPPKDRAGYLGFLSLLKRLRETYDASPDRVEDAGLQLTEAIQSMLAPSKGGGSPEEGLLNLAVQAYQNIFDQKNGGVMGAPKFPSSLPVRLLMRDYLRKGDRKSLSMAEVTLQRMAAGGIHDQAGGGFHRYATDEGWLIPHFEKMLYDNAQLVIAYLEGYQLTRDEEFANVARETLRYLQRDMTSPDGAFYAASDADSLTESGHREEGIFFTWTPQELADTLGRERSEIVAHCYGVTERGNFEGRSILHREKTTAQLASELKLGEAELNKILQESRELLYQARKRRPLPLRDEKILASWNGLAISAFARAGVVLNDTGYVDAARKAAGFVVNSMMSEGRLLHSYQEGEAKGEAFLDDYANVMAGLIDLFEVTGEALWLERSLELAEAVQEQFEDRERGGYFMTGPRHEALISREKPAYDGVVPSGNSVMIMNLLRLNALTGKPQLMDQAKRALEAFAYPLASAPTAHSEMLLALHYLHDAPKEIVIVAPAGKREAAGPFLQKLAGVFIANRALVVACEGDEMQRASELVPLLRDKKANGDSAVAYLCENRSCRAPTSDPEEFYRQLTYAVSSRSGEKS